MLTSCRPKGGTMLDLKYIRENAPAVEENCKNRGVEADVGLVVELANRRSALIGELNELKQHQNQLAKSVGRERDEDARLPLQAQGSRRARRLFGHRGLRCRSQGCREQVLLFARGRRCSGARARP